MDYDKKLEGLKGLFENKVRESDGSRYWSFGETFQDTALVDQVVCSDAWEINDGCYEVAALFFEGLIDALDDGADVADIEVSDLVEADVYTTDLTRWLAESLAHVEYLDEAIDLGTNGEVTGANLLMLANQLWKEAIARCVLDAVADYLNS